MRALAALLILAALGAGCSKRERANPFDPLNPSTGGRPAGFTAVAGSSRVSLRWNAANTPDLIGYQLSRRIAGSTEFVPLGDLLHPAVTVYQDFGLANGVLHTYRLSYVLSSGIAGTPAEDFATPGTLRPWVVDFTQPGLLRITPDARYVSERSSGFSATPALDVDLASGVVWIVDQGAGHVVLYNPASGARLTIPGIADPVAVAVDSKRRVGWICDLASDQVFLYDEGGDPVAPIAITPLADPLAVAVDASDGAVWVAESAGARVSRFREDGLRLASARVDHPSRVAVDSISHEAWVTSFSQGRAFRISAGGAVLDTVTGLSGPIGIAIDVTRDRIWIADALASQLVVIDPEGRIQFRVLGLSECREVAIDAATGDAWATLPGSGEVVRVSPAGVVLGRVRGLGAPYGIALDPAQR